MRRIRLAAHEDWRSDDARDALMEMKEAKVQPPSVGVTAAGTRPERWVSGAIAYDEIVQQIDEGSWSAAGVTVRSRFDSRALRVWTRYRIMVEGAKAHLYVHGRQPALPLIVNDLNLGGSSGGVALWIGPGTEGDFTGFQIKADK
jgi:hypothetical protein